MLGQVRSGEFSLYHVMLGQVSSGYVSLGQDRSD